MIKPHFLLACLLLQAPCAWALEGDTFRPYVSFTQAYDDNLFRQSDKKVINFGGQTLHGPQSDTYSILDLGLNVDWRIERQQVLARVAKNAVRYSKFDTLNNDGSDYLAQWNWQLGNYWSGQIGATDNVAQSSFTDLNTIAVVNNLHTTRTQLANAYWQFHPRWQIGAGVHETRALNSDPGQQASDFIERSGELDLIWLSPKGSRIQTQLRQADAKYPNRQFGFVDNSYTEKGLNVSGVWPYSVLLRLLGELGYSKREHLNVPQRDFSGLTGKATAEYFPTGKTIVRLSVYRALGEASEISSSYRLAKGASLNALWAITPKLSLRGELLDETADFLGDPGFFLFKTPVRVDKIRNGSLSLSYQPLQSTVVALGLQTGQRDSNNLFNDSNYKFKSIFANVRVDF